MILKFQNTGLIKSGTALGGIKEPTPPGPVLPPFTIRVKFNQGFTPYMGDTQTLVDAEENIWDITKNSTDWSSLLYSSNEDYDVLEVLAANTTGVTNMSRMFEDCTRLTTVPLFDTSSVTSMYRMFHSCIHLTTVPLFNTSNVMSTRYMFYRCISLTAVPLLDTSSVTTMNSMFYNCSSLTAVPLFNTMSATTMSTMFYGCINVQSGALALYQQASSQSTVPYHSGTFYNCGSNTTTGAAELAQIPDDWIYEDYED